MTIYDWDGVLIVWRTDAVCAASWYVVDEIEDKHQQPASLIDSHYIYDEGGLFLDTEIR